MDLAPTTLSFYYQLSKFGDLATCSKTLLYNLQQEIQDVEKLLSELKNNDTDKSKKIPNSSKLQDIKKDKSFEELKELLSSLETVGHVVWLKVFMHMSNYLRTFRSPIRNDSDIPMKSIPFRNIDFPDSMQGK